MQAQTSEEPAEKTPEAKACQFSDGVQVPAAVGTFVDLLPAFD